MRNGTPRPIIDRLQRETRNAMQVPEVKERMVALGIEPIGGAPEEFSRLIRAERDKWIPLFRKIGIKPQ